jgi:hypothetical protein
MIVDPCDGRNWFMALDPHYPQMAGGMFTGNGPAPATRGVYPWNRRSRRLDFARPGGGRRARTGPKCRSASAWSAIKQEILRVEGHPEEKPAPRFTPTRRSHQEKRSGGAAPRSGRPYCKSTWQEKNRRRRRPVQQGPEEIHERWMDCRYANTPTLTREGRTTLLEQMDDEGMTFLSAPTEGADPGERDRLHPPDQRHAGLRRGSEARASIRREWPG